MPEEEPKKGLESVKKNQQVLKDQIKQLEEGVSAPKPYSFQTEELREMVQNLLVQNKRLAEKVDYLLSILVEASSELSDDVFDKTLAAMAKSQVDMMDQLAMIKDKLETGKAKSEEISAMYKTTEQKLKGISDAISQLSYAKQLDNLCANIGTISSDVKKLGGVISTQTPELKANIGMLRSELSDLKTRVSEMGTFGSEIKEVETQLAEVESLLSKKEEKAVTELGPEDRQALKDLSRELFELSNEVKKMEKAFETYPSSDAQQVSGVKQKLDSLEESISSLKQSPQQDSVMAELNGLKSKIGAMERLFEQKELDMEKKREAEMQILTGILKKIENDLEALGGQQATQLSQVLADLNEKTKEMAENLQRADVQKIAPQYFSELKSQISGIGMRLAKIEDYVKTERVADASHVADVHAEVKAIRKDLEGMSGTKVKSQVISKVKEDICGIELPVAKVITPEEKRSIMAIKTNIARTQEAIRPSPSPDVREMKKNLQSAEERVNNIITEIGKSDQHVIETRETVKKLRGDVLGAPMRNEDVISTYITKLSVGTPIKIRDIATILNMDKSSVARILLLVQKDNPHRVAVRNTGYLSKLFGREPTFIRLQ